MYDRIGILQDFFYFFIFLPTWDRASPVIKICVNANPIFYERIKSGRAQTISAQVRVYSDDEYIFEEKTRSLSGSWRV